MKNFKEDYPEAKTLLLYRGQQTLMKKDILCMPVEDFLRTLNPNELLL